MMEYSPRLKFRSWFFSCLISWLALYQGTALAQDGRPFGIHHKPFGDAWSSYNYGRDRSYDVHHVKLDIVLDEKQATVQGTIITWLSPLHKGFQTLELDAAELNIQRVTLNPGENLKFSTHGEKLRIVLPRAFSPEETLAVAVTYKAHPRKGLFFVRPNKSYPKKPYQIWSQGEMEDNHFWFPCYDYPNDKMTSEMIATVNNQFMVISNGKLLEVQDNQNATKTYHWKESAPHSSYLISLVAGEFEKLTDSFQNISVEYYVRKQFVDWAPRSFSKTPDMMQFFSEITEVTYPYEKYAQTAIQDFTFGGMENISATTLTENTLHDEIAASDVTSDGLVAHELAHQWWGDLVTCENWSHAWLNESFATYFDALYVEHSKGKSEFQWEMLGNRKSFLEEDFEKYRRPIVTFFYTDPVNLFDGHLYPKGAWVLHMLRFELGDKIFFQGLHHYLKQHAYQPVETDDLRQALEDASGKNLDRFFEQWLYHGGYPEFDLSWSWDPNTQEVTLSVQQAQALDALTPIFSVPVEVKLVTETGSKSCRIRSDSLQQRFKFESLQNPKMVLFDPEGWILKLKRFHKSEGEWLYQLGHAVNVVSRIEAAATLGIKPASVASIAALKEALQNDSFYGVRIEAAHSLGEFRTAEALQALKTGLNDAKSVVRREVVKALGKFEGQVQAAEWVFLSFKTDKSYFVRADALTALGKLKSPQAPDVLMQALKIDSYREVIRSGALKGFAEFGDASNAAILMNWAKYGQPKDARNVAIEALGKLGKAHRSDKIGQFLLQLLADPDFRARRAAVSALGEMKYTDALNELWKSARQEWDGRLRQQAREAIKKILGFKKK